MALDTVAKRRYAMDQSLANSSLEGHQPSAEYLADRERYIRGEMTLDEARAASLARALEADRLAAEAGRLDTVAKRRYAMEQGLANSRIEGHQPSAECLADIERYILGEMTLDEAGAASLARALEADRLAAEAGRVVADAA